MKRETTTAAKGNTLVKHPDDIHPTQAWRNIRVVFLKTGQARPYADRVDRYQVIFEGGSPSTKSGWDHPSFRRDHEYNKEICKSLLVWTNEDGIPLGKRSLTKFSVIEEADTHTTYEVEITDPYCD